MSNLAKLYNMAPSRLHAIYGGGSKIHQEESSIHPEEEDIKEEPMIYTEEDESSIHTEKEDLNPMEKPLTSPSENKEEESQIPPEDSPLVDGGDSKTENLSDSPEEEDNKEKSKILPDIPSSNGGDSEANKEELQIHPEESKMENPSDSPLNEVDRLFANLTGGSQNNNTNSSDYIYKLIEPEDLRLWLFDERLQMSNDVSGGAANDDQSNTFDTRSSPYYSEFQALIDGLI